MPFEGLASRPCVGVWRRDLNDLLRLSAPVVGARLGIMTMGLSDSIVVGRFSARELGYHALGWAPTAIVVTMLIGLLNGAQVMAARAHGEGRPDLTGAVLRRSLSYSAWLGLASTILLLLAGPLLLTHAGLSADLARGSSRVLIVFALSMIPYGLSCAAIFWLEGMGRPQPGMWAMWVANALNLIVDLVVVPGRFGLAAQGAMGGAWATFTARSFLSVAMIGYILRMPEARAWGVFAKPAKDVKAEVAQRRVGYAAGASNAFEVTAFASLNLFAGWMGGFAVAAWSVTINLAALVFMVPLGLGAATAVLVGRAYGARDPVGIRRAGEVSFGVTTLFGVVIGIAVFPAARWIASLYTSEPTTQTLSAGLIALSSLFFWPDALQTVAAQALRARGDTLWPTLIHMTSYVAVMIPLAFVLSLPAHHGLTGLMEAVIIASYLVGAVLLVRFWILTRRDAV